MMPIRPDALLLNSAPLPESPLHMGNLRDLDVQIESHIESQPISLRQAGIVILGFMVMVLDGMDLQILGLSAPKILKDWGLTKAMLGPALAMTVVGMALGALCGGWLGDKIGRKPTILSALGLIGFATIACGFARNIGHLALFRFVCGIGGGACFPGATTLIAEWLPLRKKSLAIGVVTVGIPVGGMLGAALVIATLAQGGWQRAFFIGGALPIALALPGLVLFAESPSWLASRNARDEEVKALVRRVLPAAPMPSGRFVVALKTAPGSRQTILGPKDRRASLGLWLAFYMNVLATSGVVTWGTILLTGLGFPIAFAVSVVFFLNLVSVGAMATCSFVTNYFGSRPIFLFASIAAVVCIAIVSSIVAVEPMNAAVPVGLVVAGGFLFMNQTLLYIIAAQAYSVELRSTGVGFASLASRFASATSAIAGGIVLSLGSSLYFLFAVAVAAILAAAGALIIDRHVLGTRRLRVAI